MDVRQTDIWLSGRTLSAGITGDVVQLDDAEELLAFYDRQGLHFWSPAMLDCGHAYGVRVKGELAAAAGINFVLARQRYAQLGSLASDARYRRRGFATACARAVITSLNQSGVAHCGLFADSKESWLLDFYARLGFHQRGLFHFVEL